MSGNLQRLASERRSLAATDGLRFWRLCGTGAGSSTAASADLRRRAVFALWADEADLDAFLVKSPLAAAWRGAAEYWHVRMRGAVGHGTWRGVDVVETLGRPATMDGPVAFITRADIRSSAQRRFQRSGPAVDQELHAADGLRAVVAIGEAPILRQGTFSLWDSAAAARAFAHDSPHHRAVVERTRREGWYSEEMFAAFSPYASSGTWDGVDPLTR